MRMSSENKPNSPAESFFVERILHFSGLREYGSAKALLTGKILDFADYLKVANTLLRNNADQGIFDLFVLTHSKLVEYHEKCAFFTELLLQPSLKNLKTTVVQSPPEEPSLKKKCM